MTPAMLFYHPLTLPTDSLLWLMLPLLVSLAVVYKTVRTRRLRRLPLEILTLVGLIVAGVIALGVGFWAIQAYWL